MRLPHLCVLPRHYTDWCEQHAVGCHLNPLARKHLDETLVGGGRGSERINWLSEGDIYMCIYVHVFTCPRLYKHYI